MNKINKCPCCGSEEFWLSKNKMRLAILDMIKYKGEKSIYQDGNLSKTEIFAVYKFLKDRKGKNAGNKSAETILR